MFACINWLPVNVSLAENLRELADAFSPWVEQVAPDTVLFSLDGLQRLYGDAVAIAKAISARTPEAQVAIAATPDAAVLAAQNLKGTVVIPAGEEIRYLGSLS